MAGANDRNAIRLDPDDATPQSVRMAVDKMGKTDYAKEDRRRKSNDLTAERVDQASKQSQQ
ncbi:hypothetical protein [Burkholderia cenocepacia]|uniref:hypothetical protein n=1 Tax=Burkholderia cenocepacia TaxID=95486 RepID=UPI000D52D1E8|nr:hypothetical protein [Burkholderia cenocepacia]